MAVPPASSQPITKLESSSLVECGPHRLQSRSVSWNQDGSVLAMASSCHATRLWTLDSGSTGAAKETMSITGHTAPVLKVSFSGVHMLASAGADASVRLWDIRSGSQKASGRIEAQAVDLHWNPVQNNILSITERLGSIALYDVRKLNATVANIATHNGQTECAMFDPTGELLYAGATVRGDSMASIQTWNWKKEEMTLEVPAHAGPIYSMAACKDLVVSGGADATLGIWDSVTMCSIGSVTRRSKYLRGVSISFDANIIAISSEEDTIDVTNANGDKIGLANLGIRPRSAGAEDICFHPTAKYLLACARCDNAKVPTAPLTILKLGVRT